MVRPAPSSAQADRAAAEAALTAWHRGAATADSVLPLLTCLATTATDYANLGAVLRAANQLAAAETAARHAIALDPALPAAHYNLGNLLTDTGRLDDAVVAYRAAVALWPTYAAAWNGLGLACQRLGALAPAAEAFRQATTHAPHWADAQVNLGVALLGCEQYEAAGRALRMAIAIAPNNAAAKGNLGALYLRAGCPIAAEAACREAIALAPREHRWISNLAGALQIQGRHEETEALYRQALALRPDYASGHGNLLFALNYRHDLAAEAIFAEYQAWDRTHAVPLARSGPHPSWPSLTRPSTPDRPCADGRVRPGHDGGAGEDTSRAVPDRRLRVGYVSPDFRQHAVALFAEPVLAAHDRTRIELFCYAEVPLEDATTARFRALADHWRSTVGQSDAAVADLICRDGIDVLVDLGGHTAGNRLLVFARKPAPVQVAWLLGHGYTTGLSAMDAFLADDQLVPAGSESLFSERILRLPRIPIAYAPPARMPPVAPLPATTNGYVTFGHFGRPERLNPDVIATWAGILNAVPGSRLVLNNRAFQEPAFQDLIAGRFGDHGIARGRLDLIYTAPQPCTWVAYGAIDIALDPFPHNAGTTTIEALWMGVPVVTLADRPSVGRIGASILHAVGLDDWVASGVDAYVARALAAAADLAALVRLRAGLRGRLGASPLLDAAGLARCLEDTYRHLHQTARPDETPRLRQLYLAGDKAAARDLAETILRRDPANPAAAHIAGLIAHADQRLADADHYLRIAVAAAPGDPEPHANHAAILRGLGRLEEAEQAARAALALAPDRIETHNNLGNILRDAGRFEDSIAAYHAALRLRPDFADGWANLAWVQSLLGRAKEAEQAARQAIRHDPANVNGHNNLGLALMRQSRLREAEVALRRALALRPDFPLAHSNILFCLNYRDDMSGAEIFGEYQRWNDAHARRLAPAHPAWDLDRTPGRRLRVGYVSPDFRQHAVALFAEPLLAAHDRGAVEVVCYAEVPAEDATTQRFRALADHWRSTVGLTDAAVAEMIRGDRIDVLVDLAGHTAGNRLLAFARRPAPVQIEFMLGHGYTSGLSAMDAFLSDARLTPPGAEALFSERPVRLSRIPLAYLPPAGMPEVATLPALATGHVTFGYFGRTVRLNDAVIATWARILTEIPGARLMLNSAPLAEPEGRDDLAARFVRHGVTADRLDLVFTTPQPRTWEAYGQIDIALDPFPHNAGTTTIEALWMGVPVLTLAGRPSVGRFGASILGAVGLDDWVTDSVEAYVARAVAAAGGIAALARLRAGLRQRFIASPLHDAHGLARTIEAAYRALWDDWREDPVARMHRLCRDGDRDAALALATRLLAEQPDHGEALHVAGVLAFAAGDAARACHLLGKAPLRPDILSDLGVALRAQGRLAEAEQAYRRALALQPDMAAALGNLGNVLLDLKRPDDAQVAFDRALLVAPEQPWLLRGKALALLARDDADHAEPLLRRALCVRPDDAEAHETLAVLLAQSGRPVEAEAHYRQALPRIRDRHRCLSNLAITLQMQGRHAETEACFRQALALRPDYATAHGNLLFALNYRDDLPAEAIFREYQAWDRQHAAALAPPHPSWPERAGGRGRSEPRPRLRVGYVSPDFRQHAVALFAEPLLAAHDRSVVEVFCYAEVAVEDAVTARFKALADQWRSTVGRTDAAVADMVRQDRIDVLVDLAGHTGGNRLLAFAHRPAPVQVAYILGHGTTSGLGAMDVFLADDALAPPEADALFSERLIRLPRIPIAYRPPAGMPPVVEPPALASGHVTFGYFGRPDRLNDRVIAAWSAILHGVPGARLLLNSRPFLEAAFRGLIAGRFAAHGIPADRLEMVFTSPQDITWQAYGWLDIALDPFPHNAGTTTIEALWMGVPVVTRADRPPVGRFGASILHAVGLDDWVAADDAGYVARAVRAAADPAALAVLRRRLREQVAASPLCDAAELARVVEATFGTLREANQSPPLSVAAE